MSLDIGSAETPDRIQSFECRRRSIECTPPAEYNTHIAGTYFTALKCAGTYFTAVKYAGPYDEWATFKNDNLLADPQGGGR